MSRDQSLPLPPRRKRLNLSRSPWPKWGIGLTCFARAIPQKLILKEQRKSMGSHDVFIVPFESLRKRASCRQRGIAGMANKETRELVAEAFLHPFTTSTFSWLPDRRSGHLHCRSSVKARYLRDSIRRVFLKEKSQQK